LGTGYIEYSTDIMRLCAASFAGLIDCLISVLKGKAIPLQAWTGPEGSRRLRLSDFKTVST